MMKIPLILITSLFLGGYNQNGPGKSPAENEHVGVSIILKHKTMAVGDSNEILINFKPEDQYFINTDPHVSIKLDSNKIIASVGKIQIQKGKKPDYVNTSQPVKLQIMLRKNVKKGAHELKGTLTYFFCSDADGWCSKFKQPFTLKITVK
jgi:hypothetical protein